MPDYDFRCTCGELFTLTRAIKDYPAVAQCPECGSDTTKRIYSIAVLRRAGRTVETEATRPKVRISGNTVHRAGGAAYSFRGVDITGDGVNRATDCGTGVEAVDSQISADFDIS